MRCRNGPRSGIKIEDTVNYPALWYRLVHEQSRYIKRLLRAKNRHLAYGGLYFGDFQHPDIAGMFGYCGSDAFGDARDRWVKDVRSILDESALDRLARAI